jgi:hypothetical protein
MSERQRVGFVPEVVAGLCLDRRVVPALVKATGLKE